MSDGLLSHGTVTPAYGRDYPSGRVAREAFEDGKDFILQTYTGSGYVSKRDFRPGAKIVIRFGAMRKTIGHTVGTRPAAPKPRKPRAVRSTGDARAERSSRLQAMAARIEALPLARSFRVDVYADNSGRPAGNALRFATREEAEGYAQDLASRWFLVQRWDIVESVDPVNYRWTEDGLRNA